MNRTIINKNLKVRHESLYVAKHIGVIIDPIPSHAFFILRNQDMKIKRRITIIATPKKQCCTKETNKKISKSRKGQKNSLETRQKISLSLQKKHPMRGKKLSEEHKRKISDSLKINPPMKGKHFSEETKRKLSESHKGQIAWNKGKTGIYSEETRKKMSESRKGKAPWNKGKFHSDESKKKMSEVRIEYYKNKRKDNNA